MNDQHWGAYHFDGDPDVLLAGYRRLLEQFPLETLDVHVCVRHDAGLTMFDACPSREVFEQFSTGEPFRAAVAAAGMPAPRPESLGTIVVAHVRNQARV